MPLSDVQIDRFRQDGYVAVPHFFSAHEVKAIQNEVRRLKENGKLRNVATEADGKTMSTRQRNLQLCPMHKDSSLFRALPFAPQVIDAVAALIGNPIILHLDQVFLKPGGDGMGTNWHQDNSYFKISDPMMGTAMWIAAHDATIANGTLHVIPGVFRQSFQHERDPNSDHHIFCRPDESLQKPIELEAGGVIFFCYGTPHCTKANRTDKERAGVAYHFLRADFAPAALIEENRDYRPYLTGPKATGGQKEYGVKIAGTWEKEVEHAL